MNAEIMNSCFIFIFRSSTQIPSVNKKEQKTMAFRETIHTYRNTLKHTSCTRNETPIAQMIILFCIEILNGKRMTFFNL